MKHKFKKLAAAFLSGLMVIGTLAGSAFAANDSLPPDVGTLTIHKYLMDDVAQADRPNNGHEAGQNGNPDIPAGAEALEGVTFGLWQIDTEYDQNGNLTKPVAFPTTAEEAEQMLAAGTLTMTKVGDYTTGADGSVKIDNLKGYYYVKELRSTQTQVATAAEPFLVAVPMTDSSTTPSNSGWIMDVHVYPKNSPLLNSKVVDDAMVSPGDYYEQDNTLVWKINSDIPSNIADAAASITENPDRVGGYYRVVDELDKSFVYTADTLKVFAGMAKNEETVELVKDTDYKLYVGEKTDGSATTITVDLTKAGMEKLAAGAGNDLPYSNLFITFNTVLDKDATQNAMIKNVPKTYFSADPKGDPGKPEDPDNPTPDPNDPNTPTTPDPEDVPYVLVGSITLKKTNEDGTSPLAGAKFKIATSEQNAKDGVYMQIGGQDAEAVSGDDGTVTFTNLPLTPEFDQDGTFTGFKEEAYWLVEVEAPEGYNLLPTPIKVPVLDDIAENEKDADGDIIPNHVEFKAGTDRINNVEFKIVNTKNFTLPSTGGTGTVLFTIGGIALIGAAVILFIVTRKRRTV